MATIQLNLRVKPSVAEEFKRHCKELHLTQSDGLKSLLALRDREEAPTENCCEVDSQQADLLRQEKDLTRVLQHTLRYVLYGELPPETDNNTGMYQYPTASACGIISLEDLVLDGAALHVYGITQGNAARIKLTALDQTMFPLFNEYATQHSHWLVGYVCRPDGTAEIVTAVPAETLGSMCPLRENSNKRSDGRMLGIDAQISGAASRHVYSKHPRIG